MANDGGASAGRGRRFAQGWRVFLLGLLASTLAACATIEPPYIFAEQGVVSPATPSAKLESAPVMDLGSALALAREAQRQWAESARGEADRKHAVSVGLLGLSTIALIKAMTSPNATDLAALGGAGAGLYAWGSTMTSSARNAIYREGIASLACAVEAVSPYANPVWLGTGTQPTIDTLLDQALSAESGIDVGLQTLRPLNVSRTLTRAARTLPAECAELRSGRCTAAAPGSASAQLCEQLQSRCVPRAATSVEEKPHPDLAPALALAEEERKRLDEVVTETMTLKAQALTAGSWLWRTGNQIEQRVRDGIEKTEPDLATVLAVSQALRSPPPSARGPSAQNEAPPEGEGQSGVGRARAGERTAKRPPGLDALLSAIAGARQVRQTLERRNRILRNALASSRSENCRRLLPLGAEPDPNPPASNAGAAPVVTPQPKGDPGAPGTRQLPSTSGG